MLFRSNKREISRHSLTWAVSNSEGFEFGLIYHLRPNKGKRVWGSWGEEGNEETSHGKVARKMTINLFFSKTMFSKFCYADLHW